jgi:hypothetical protein
LPISGQHLTATHGQYLLFTRDNSITPPVGLALQYFDRMDDNFLATVLAREIREPATLTGLTRLEIGFSAQDIEEGVSYNIRNYVVNVLIQPANL